MKRLVHVLQRSPRWLESDGNWVVEVRGYSVLEGLAALLAGIVVMAAAIVVIGGLS